MQQHTSPSLRRAQSILSGLLILILVGMSGFQPGLATTSTRLTRVNSDIAGLWRTNGYGWVFEITPQAVKAYQVTSSKCVTVFDATDIIYEGNAVTAKNAQFPGVAALLADISGLRLVVENGELVFDSSGVVPIVASRIDALPPSCADGVDDSRDPENVFDVFWHMTMENYAFFDLRGVDWKAMYDTYRQQVTAKTTETELFDILQQTLSGLKDAHVNLIASPTQVYKAGQYAAWTQNHDKKVVATYLNLVENKYVRDVKTLANDNILYGHLSPTVGYINFLTMIEFGHDGDDGNDIDALKIAMPTIVKALADVKAVVVDVRFNGGGDDANATYIAGYFAGQKTLAFSKRAWNGSTFLEKHDIYVEPVTEPHFAAQAVYLLTSNYTTSAGEVFTVTMNALPQVISVGEKTQGAFSDLLFTFLPNGWLVTLSNEEYTSSEGKVYEGTGVPPKILVPMSPDALQKGVDPIIERVLSQVNTK